MIEMQLRPAAPADRAEIAELIYASINVWYALHRGLFRFVGGPHVTDVFFETYQAVGSRCVVAENKRTGRLMGSCYYHPRKHHVSLGIMNVHPNYFGHHVGTALLQSIIDFTEQNGYKSLRLTSSAMNLDSFSLYNRAAFVPRLAFQDMLIPVPAQGLACIVPGTDRVRPARLDDVSRMAELEMEVSGISREEDYRHCIANAPGFWHVAVLESAGGGMDGWIISSAHPAMNMLGPCVTRSEPEAAALIAAELDQHRRRSPVVLIPMERRKLVEQLYSWGARNCEMHFCQVRGEFKPFAGISLPSFLPETA